MGQYCAEHGVLTDGKNPDTSDDVSFRCFIEETKGGLFVPRNLSVDVEPNKFISSSIFIKLN